MPETMETRNQMHSLPFERVVWLSYWVGCTNKGFGRSQPPHPDWGLTHSGDCSKKTPARESDAKQQVASFLWSRLRWKGEQSRGKHFQPFSVVFWQSEQRIQRQRTALLHFLQHFFLFFLSPKFLGRHCANLFQHSHAFLMSSAF